MIEIELDNSDDLSPCPTLQQFQHWVKAALASKREAALIAIKIVDEDTMQQLNHAYRQKAKPTNILSFPSQLPPALGGDFLGDLAICIPIVQQEALAQHKTFEAHFAHLVIHGTLHLLGFDHENEEDAHQMENEEIRILSTLGLSNPYYTENFHDE